MRYTELFRLDGTTALVIGAGGGIGTEIVRGLADHGANVVCADVDAAAAERAAADVGDGARALRLDVTSTESVSAALADVGPPGVLVSTVGTNVRKRIADYTEADVRRVLDVNLVGTVNVLRAFGPAMAGAGGGSIIAFASIRATTVEPGQGVYAATKAGVVQLMRTAAAELGPAGVRCNVVAPGVVETPLTQQIMAVPAWRDAYAAKSVFGRWATPSELVGAVVYLAAPASSFVTGAVLHVDGGWTAVDGRFDPPT